MRYIDADKLIKKIFPIGLIDDGNYTINAKAVKIAIDKMPTADVVPTSEVEKIFGEIERTFNAVLVGDISDILKVLATLKKKYTEGEGRE